MKCRKGWRKISVVENEICVTSKSGSGKANVSKVAAKNLKLHASGTCEHPQVTDVAAQDTLGAKIA